MLEMSDEKPLRSATSSNINPKYAGILSIVEVGLGSFLHGLKLPLSGQILSLNQIFLISRASRLSQSKESPAIVSTCAALFKTLAPAGKKLTPMLALSVQGHLFTLGCAILGTNILGRLLGGILASLWAYIQPLCLYLILFGKDLIFIYQYFFKKLSKFLDITEDQLLLSLGIIISIKVFLAIVIVIAETRISEQKINQLENWARNQKYVPKNKNKNNSNKFMAAFRDLMNPLFIFSLVLTGLFFFYARNDYSQFIWSMLRPLAIGYLIFLILRLAPLESGIEKLKDGKYKTTLQKTIRYINSI